MARRSWLGGRSGYRSASPNDHDSVTGSGERVRKHTVDAMARLAQPWQSRAFAYYDLLPEINYASQFYSRSLSVVRLYAGERQEDGTIEETKNPKVIEQLERIQDPGGGGRSGLLASYGRLIFLAGEGYLFVTNDKDTQQEQWEMLSTDELKPNPGGTGYLRYSAPSLQAETFRAPSDDDFEPIGEGDGLAYRLWRRHPRYSALATSTMQSVLDIAEELVLLTQAVRARARSRLAGSGILIVNGAVIPAPLEAAADENADEDPFMRDLVDAMTSPIANEGVASAVVPHVVRVDVPDSGDLDDVMKHIQIVDPIQLYPETGLRLECIQRLAIGLDLPPEVLLGMTKANHWSAWMVDEMSWKAHLQPVAEQLVSDLTSAFLQPTLREMGIADWRKYVVAYDPSAAINHPDRSKDAKDAHSAGAIGDATLREATGFTDEDQQTPEERRHWLAVKARDPKFALGEEDDETEIPEAPLEEPDEEPEEAKAPPVRDEDEEAEERLAASAAIDLAAARVLGAADLALHRARELAGARLRNFAKRDPETLALLDGVRAPDIPKTLGLEGATRVRAPAPAQLVGGARQILLDAFALWRIDETLAGPLGDQIEQHAAATLYSARPVPLPASFAEHVKTLDLLGAPEDPA